MAGARSCARVRRASFRTGTARVARVVRWSCSRSGSGGAGSERCGDTGGDDAARRRCIAAFHGVLPSTAHQDNNHTCLGVRQMQ